jgi:N6-adenosine-specific RNA methylase IME4
MTEIRSGRDRCMAQKARRGRLRGRQSSRLSLSNYSGARMTEEAAEIQYGKLQEGLHITGYSFERACAHLEWLLEGDRWKLGKRFKDVNAFMESVRLDKFRVVAEQRKRITNRIKELQSKVSNRAIAKTLGVAEGTVRKDVAENYALAPERGAQGGALERTDAQNYAPSELTGEQAAKLAYRKSSGSAEKQARRAAHEQSIAGKILALPNKRYGVIVADPEWKFDPYSEQTGSDRAASNHYSTSATTVIASRDVASIAADDCVLFLWATAPMLLDALAVMAAWSFSYKSNYVWNKDRIGTGYWSRNKHEHLLIGTRGNIPAPAEGTQWPSVVDGKVGKHSAKPGTFLFMIEEYFPHIPQDRAQSPRAAATRLGLLGL